MLRDYGKLIIVIVKQYSSNNNIYIQILIQSTGYLPKPTLFFSLSYYNQCLLKTDRRADKQDKADLRPSKLGKKTN
jgi:hypothetical protein